MPQKTFTPLTDAELRELAQDRTVTQADVAKLSPEERTKFMAFKQQGPPPSAPGAQPQGQGQSIMSQLMSGLSDIGVGAAKGAGETMFDMGSAVRSIPGVGALTDRASDVDKLFSGGMPGVEGGGPSPSQMFAQTPQDLQAQGWMQKAGKFIEQVGEYAIPANAARKGAVEGMVRMIPDAASPRAMSTLNKVAAQTGRLVGETGSATGVSALHGDEHPERAGAVAGGSQVLGELMAALSKVPLVRKVAPFVAGGMTSHALNGADMGLASMLSLIQMTRQMTREGLSKPGNVNSVAGLIRRAVPRIGRAAAGVTQEGSRY